MFGLPNFELDRMRLMLLFIGVIALVIIYLFGRWQQGRRRRVVVIAPDIVSDTAESVVVDAYGMPDAAQLAEELAGLERLIADVGPVVSPPTVATAAPTPARLPDKDKLVTLYVVAAAGQRFSGAEVRRAFDNEGLTFGAMDIYHYLAPKTLGSGDQDLPVFSVANVTEPGTFNPGMMDAVELKGFTLFLRLPGPMDGVLAFDAMLATAQRLAGVLNGRLLDCTRSVLSRQTIQHIRDDIKGYEFRQKYRRRA